jgi:hypothetical protein
MSFLSVHASGKVKTDDTNDSFHKELERVFSEYHMIILFNFNAKKIEKILPHDLV